jgi:hypothetical protein
MAAIVLQFRSETDRAKSAMAQLASSVATNMSTVASVMGSTALTTTAATSAMGTGFGNAALAAGRFALQYRVLLGTLAIVGLGIAKAAGDLEELVSIGDKANAVRLSPETFQAFIREAERSRIAIKDAEAALKSFDAANKLKFDPSNEQRPNQPSPLGKFLEDIRLIQRELENSPALDKFLNAADQNAKLRATIDLIKELQTAGLELAATGLAEKAFGGAGEKIAEEIRKGKFEMESLVQEGKAAGLIFDNELVQRAVALRDRLEAASREIGDNLTPLLRGSVVIAEALATAFVGATEAVAGLASGLSRVVSLLGAAVSSASQLLKLGPTETAEGIAGLEAKRQRRINLENAIRDGRPAEADDPFVAARNRLAAGQGQPLGTGALPGGLRTPIGLDGTQLTGRNVIIPQPSRRPTGLDKVDRGGGGSAGAGEDENKRLKEVENFIKALEKANRLAEAELKTAGLSNAEKAKAAALARIGSELTDEQRLKIEQLAESTSKYNDKNKEIEEQLRRNAEAGRFMGDAISDALSDVIIKGEKAGEVAKRLLQSLGSSALKGLLTGQGPFGGGGSGLLGGLFSGLFKGATTSAGAPFSLLPSFAVGSDKIMRSGLANIHAGEMIIPAGPASALRARGFGGSGGISIVNNNDFRGADPSMRAYIEQRLAVSEARTVGAARASIAKDRRDGRF